MNEVISKFCRDTLINDLARCTDAQRMIFKRMYSHKNTGLPIDVVVDNMPDEKLDWAMQQVSRSLNKSTPAEVEHDQ